MSVMASKLNLKVRFNKPVFPKGSRSSCFFFVVVGQIRLNWDHLMLIDTFRNWLLDLPDGTMCTNWGNPHWETMIHCGAMEALSSCQCSVALSSNPPLDILRLTEHCLFVLLHVQKRCQNLQLPRALSSAEAFKEVANPVDIAKHASSATNSTNYAVNSAPSPSGSCPCGPGGSQGLVAFSWRGFGNRDSWDLWPPG